MNSAAVIGRQLRQQATSSRISGPVVPPTQYKGIHRAPSSYSSIHVPVRQQDRDLQSIATQSNLGADADKKFAQFSQLYSHEFYPHPAHRERPGEKSAHRTKEKKKKEPRVVLSWHCFCVALKALSSGIILLLAGTAMSVVGFFADSLSAESVRLQNGTLVTRVDDNVKTHLHNLTYVGPVIMGLGGMVLVAACVLTFEVRDTLGVKMNPVEKSPEKADERSNHQMKGKQGSANSRTHSRAEESKAHRSVADNALNQNHLPANSSKPNQQQQQQGSRQSRPSEKSADSGLAQEGGQRCRNLESGAASEKVPPNSKERSSVLAGVVSSQSERYFGQQQRQPQPTSASTTDLFSIDMSFVRIPSPQDTELSDPEGCSLNALSRWKSRCSCSGSPTNSMLLALHNFDDRQRSHPLYINGSAGRKGAFPPPTLIPQLPHRYSKILASVESDGLSSSTSSEWDIRTDFRLLETQQRSQLHHSRPSDHPLQTKQREEACDQFGQRNSPRTRGNVSRVAHPPCWPAAAPPDANCKSETDHRSVQYPLLEMQPLPPARHERNSSCQPN